MDRKYAVQGIMGCALFGVGDWLLGFVDPGEVPDDVFYFISAGHGAGYPDWKIIVTMVCAVIFVADHSFCCNDHSLHILIYVQDFRPRAGGDHNKWAG